MAVRTKEKQKVNDEGLQKLHPYLCKGTKQYYVEQHMKMFIVLMCSIR